jgi:hypothetical protein
LGAAGGHPQKLKVDSVEENRQQAQLVLLLNRVAGRMIRHKSQGEDVSVVQDVRHIDSNLMAGPNKIPFVQELDVRAVVRTVLFRVEGLRNKVYFQVFL